MTVGITGASGTIGTGLAESLRADGIAVRRFVRRPARTPDEISWDPEGRSIDTAALESAGLTAVVHLAGAGVGDRRWTASYKDEILSSRVAGTETLAKALAGLPRRVALISGSAIGYYGDTGTAIVDESALPGSTFLADVVVRWESATAAAIDAGLRVAFARTGLVVSRSGGAFGKMVPIFKAGIGGRLGSGRQWWSFISLTDEIRALRFLIDNELDGPFNLVAPHPVTNSEAVHDLGAALHRPAALPVPSFALRTALGEFASEITMSQGVEPRRLTAAGFTWNHPTLPQALAAELAA
ncbi:MAG: TIGR01777 family oxidoreductase [Candidatus Nanopelagicales bacterium]